MKDGITIIGATIIAIGCFLSGLTLGQAIALDGHKADTDSLQNQRIEQLERAVYE